MTYQEVNEDNLAPQPQRWGKIALAVGAACALLLVGFATGSHFMSSPAFSQQVAPLQLNAIAVTPPREECAKTGANCIAQKCCKVAGYECYEVHEAVRSRQGWHLPPPHRTNGSFQEVRHFIPGEHTLLLLLLCREHRQHQKNLRVGLVED